MRRSRLLAHHDDREGTRDRWAAPAAPATCRRRALPGRRRRRWGNLRCHREEMARLAVERNRSRAVRWPCLQVLLYLKARRTVLFDDGHRTVALRAEGFHGRRVEGCAVGTPGERQPREDVAVLRTQDDECLRRLGVRIG